MNTILSHLSTEVDILINEKPIKKFAHQGKTFIEAKENSEYTIRVKNNSWNRRLMVISTDGINIIDGKAAGSSLQGYIIQGYNSYHAKGFRVSNDSVNAFKFSKKSKSYASKSNETGGDVSNCGVIGVQIFEEKEKPQPIVIHQTIKSNPWPKPYYPVSPTPWEPHWWTSPATFTCNSIGGLNGEAISNCYLSRGASEPTRQIDEDYASSDGNLLSSKRSFDLGTQFSSKEITDKVKEVEFEIGLLLGTIEIFYASRDGLLDMGVPLDKEAAINFPQSFPSSFCKKPQ